MNKNVLLIDAFSTLHVGNGALIEDTYKLVRKNTTGRIDILSIDPRTNVGHFPNVYEDIFSQYGGSGPKKLKFAVSILWFFVVEFLNIKLFKSAMRFPWGENKRKLLDLIDATDVCVSLSGETINDHYYPHMYQRLLVYWLAVLKGKDFVCFPQSIGPVFRGFSKWLLRLTLGRSKVIIARDQQSYKLSQELWRDQPVQILFCPDVAITQDSTVVPIPNAKAVKKLVGLTVSDIPRAEMQVEGDYLTKILNAVKKNLDPQEYELVLMPSNYKHNGISKDYEICTIAKKFLVDAGYDAIILGNQLFYPSDYQGMQRNLFLFISTRMHVGILGTSAGIPTFMINTQHKILAYMENIGMERYVGQLDEPSELWDMKLQSLIKENAQIRSELVLANSALRTQIENTIQEVFAKL